jgi:ribonuclease E
MKKKEMLINVLQSEECRIAIVEDGVLEELYVERTSHESYIGNIYKGRIVNLEPAIQAAFVDFSIGRNGFLHVSDVEPLYYRKFLPADAEFSARDKYRDPRREFDDLPKDPRDPGREPRGRRDRDRGPRSGERERPDLSLRGRRDRSDTRRFGEGLIEGAEADQPERRPPIEEQSPFDTLRHDEPRAEIGAETRDEEIGFGSARYVDPTPTIEVPPAWSFATDRSAVEKPWPAADLEREREREREIEPDVDPIGWSRRDPAELEADLPPSRTRRGGGRRGAPVPPPRIPDEPQSAWGIPPSDQIEPEIPAIEPFDEEPPQQRRSRRGRGRGAQRRDTRPAPSIEPPADFSEPFDIPPVIEPDLDRDIEPVDDFIDEPVIDPVPPAARRGGRNAIRSRPGGDPNRSQPRPRDPEIGRGRVDERDRDRDRIRDRDRERLAGESRPGIESRPAGETRPPRDREPKSYRAGEPGYVPRRERSREIEPEPEIDWTESAADLDIEAQIDPTDLGTDKPTPRGKQQDQTRGRRRRRGRRRDGDRETEAFEAERSGSSQPVEPRRPVPGEPRRGPGSVGEFDAPFLDFGDEPRAAPRSIHRDLEHELDHDDDHEPLDDELDDELDDQPKSKLDDRIDPELEEEIRREVAEIAELEREMGLRPSEARPRRGDDLDVEAETGRGGRGKPFIKPPIQEIFKRGDEVLVQVIKESIGTKGPTLSTYISIPGRYLVLMPGLNRVGVSRKIADEGQRRRLRQLMNELNPPKGLGFIVRTAGLDRSKAELARDLAYLLRLWKAILRRIKKTRSPAPIYQESDMITRTIRDIFTAEIDTIWIDERSAFERAQEFLKNVMPRFVNRIKFHDEKAPLFWKYGIEQEIAKIQRRQVPLPEGGSIVIDQTEALVAIDVNSGNFRVENDAERTAYEMNLRAAKEIARQLRLRDLGGVIVNDFIDMRDERHRRGVERALREAVKRDRARTKILRISAFGMIEMTRQRIRPSLKRSVYEDCPHCAGAGVVKTTESMAIDVMRLLALAAHREDIRRVNITVSASVATYLNNKKRQEIAKLEADANMTIHVRHEEGVPAEHLLIDGYDVSNNEVRLLPPTVLPTPGRFGSR